MKRSLNWMVLVVFSLSVLSACGGGGGGGGAAGLQPPSAHLAGTWQWDEVEGANTCGDTLPAPDTYWTGVVTHATGSNNFTLTRSGDPQYTGYGNY
jgi:hypothetical protein